MIKKIILILLSIYSLSYGRTIELTGTVISDNEKFITSRFMGFVKLVNINEGDIVSQGDILYEIDSTEINNKQEQALLNVQIYQNQYDTVNRNYERYKRL
ncbi:MAG: efflux RND transporter periplasmic adaptor subunit, partial [Arcobacteraceae bacterium]|nr:efflux RND transporter periplasmic adaptor subunit [Arcobacteraceae bacterium]